MPFFAGKRSLSLWSLSRQAIPSSATAAAVQETYSSSAYCVVVCACIRYTTLHTETAAHWRRAFCLTLPCCNQIFSELRAMAFAGPQPVNTTSCVCQRSGCVIYLCKRSVGRPPTSHPARVASIFSFRDCGRVIT